MSKETSLAIRAKALGYILSDNGKDEMSMTRVDYLAPKNNPEDIMEFGDKAFCSTSGFAGTRNDIYDFLEQEESKHGYMWHEKLLVHEVPDYFGTPAQEQEKKDEVTYKAALEQIRSHVFASSLIDAQMSHSTAVVLLEQVAEILKCDR